MQLQSTYQVLADLLRDTEMDKHRMVPGEVADCLDAQIARIRARMVGLPHGGGGSAYGSGGPYGGGGGGDDHDPPPRTPPEPSPGKVIEAEYTMVDEHPLALLNPAHAERKP